MYAVLFERLEKIHYYNEKSEELVVMELIAIHLFSENEITY